MNHHWDTWPLKLSILQTIHRTANHLPLVLLASGLVGCSTVQPTPEKPPEHAQRVQVLAYDTIHRPPTAHLDIYDVKAPTRTFKVIALMTCEGAAKEEVVMTKAMFYRARMLGADGVVPADSTMTTQGTFNVVTPRGGVGGGGGTRAVFRLRAIVYEDR